MLRYDEILMKMYENSIKNFLEIKGKLFLMKDVRKIVRFLRCFSGGKCRFNILKTT